MNYRTESSGFANIAETYRRFPVTLVEGSGSTVWDSKGRSYIDFTSGIAVCNLGHCHPAVVEAVKEQAELLFHVSNLYWTEPQFEVARRLTEGACVDRVFFCNSGAESVEAAIKLARRYGHDTKGHSCYEIVSLTGSFHGRTLAAITATGQPVYQQGFEPLPPGFTHVPPNDVESLRLAVGPRTCAVLLEPIQGEGGVRPLANAFLEEARRLCDRHGALLIFDEVQVGMGRTGTLYAYEQTPVEPDVICLAKGLGNGLPIGAMLAREEVMSHLPPGSHASTFGANPVACAAARQVLIQLQDKGMLERVVQMGAVLRDALGRIAARYPDLILEIRGRGLIQAVEFSRPMDDLANWLLQRGVLALVAAGKVLRLLPPFVVSEDEIGRLEGLLDEYLAGHRG